MKALPEPPMAGTGSASGSGQIVKRAEEGPYHEEEYQEEITKYMTGMDVSFPYLLCFGADRCP
jgi:hypothetical protein